ncbi:MAG: hypothetical protein OXI67_07380 [Candidatus Poribacteria bacterium]|nr:hypothetical protein [Candidatus Poribacteria bacterium]
MLKSLFTSKPFIIAVCIFIFVCAACVLYYQSVTLQIRKENTQHEQFVRSLSEDIPSVNNSQHLENSTDSEVTNNSVSQEIINTSDSVLESENALDDARSENVDMSQMPVIGKKEVRMSPFGLGPLPEIPEGWTGRGFVNNQTIGHELIERVRIKMFADKGEYYSGGTIDHDTGLVRLTSKDRIYVSWSYANINGVPTRYISGMSAHPETGDKIRSNAKARQSETPVELRTRRRPLLIEEDIPAGVEISSLDSDGIDPYEFLGLERH